MRFQCFKTHHTKFNQVADAFTLIEVLIVLTLILILTALIIPKLLPVQQKTLRLSCAHQVKSLVEAIHVYTSAYEGQWKGITIGNSAATAYGYLFQKNGWNNLAQLICPGDTVGKAPKPAGYGNPLDMTEAGSAIDYWIVHTQNTTGDTLTPFMVPGNNVLVIEKFSGESAWLNSDFHKDGGTVGRVNGSAEFVTVFPENKNEQGDTKSILKSQCTL